MNQSSSVPHPTAPAPPSLSDRITAELRDAILRGRYQAGDRLPSERELAERFATHRGAVREALKKLEQLGIAEVRPGGCRVMPIEEASLDVVRHLIELEQPPDPALFDQVFEVFGGLFSVSARLAAERANDEQRAQAARIFEQLLGADLSLVEEHELVHDLSDLFVAASNNRVLPIVRRGLFTQTMEHIEHPEQLLRPPDAERHALLERLAKAIAEGSGADAQEAAYDLTGAIRRNAVAVLTAARERNHSPRPVGATSR